MSSAVKDDRQRPRVCLATSAGGYDHARVLDGVLGRALSLRGADVELLLCDAALPACQMTKMGRAAPEEIAQRKAMAFCTRCVAQGLKAYGALAFPVRLFGAYLTDKDVQLASKLSVDVPSAQVPALEWQGIKVGEHAHAGALRYFARGDLLGEPQGEAVLRRYLEAALLSAFAIGRVLEECRYDVLVIHHGIYVPQGIICEVAHAKGRRVVTYNPAYRKHSFIFSHGQSYHFTMLDEPLSHWEDLVMTARMSRDVQSYLTSRRYGTNDWIWFHDQPSEDVASILREAGCDPDRPYVAALTSVVWDAQLHYKANAFPGMLDWLRETVAYWSRRTDLQLVIRVHPAEIRGMIPSRQRAADELARHFPALPRNVFVLGPENQASTYALCENANATLIFNTKAGIEVASLGVPVIVAGEAWIRGKGFAHDVSSAQDYFRLLDRLPFAERMSGHDRARAEKYAYHFFFRRMIPLPFIRDTGPAKFAVDEKSLKRFHPGNFAGLDTICDGILKATPFVYPAESLDDPFPGERQC